MSRLVLASASPWRRAMLQGAGIDAEGRASGVDERAVRADGPRSLALALARAKAEAVAGQVPDRWVLGADQVVHQEGEVFGKPDGPDDHLARLQHMRGTTHELVTGWWLTGPGRPAHGVCTTRMHVRGDLTDDELAAYVATGEGAGCAGGYAAEAHGAFLFERVEGDWFNVIGLPLFEVLGALRARGWTYGEGTWAS